MKTTTQTPHCDARDICRTASICLRNRTVLGCVMLGTICLYCSHCVLAEAPGDASAKPHLRDSLNTLIVQSQGVVSVLESGAVVVSFDETPAPPDDFALSDIGDTLVLQIVETEFSLVQHESTWSITNDLFNLTEPSESKQDLMCIALERAPGHADLKSVLDIYGKIEILSNEEEIFLLRIQSKRSTWAFVLAFSIIEGDASAATPSNRERQSSSSSVSCDNGDGSISCVHPKYAFCYCDAQEYPRCDCIRRPRTIRLEEITTFDHE